MAERGESAAGGEIHTGVDIGDVEPVDALVQITFTVMGVLSRVAATYDVSLTQLRVFGILRDRRPRMAQLADFLGLEKSTMSGLVSRAEQRGLIERIPSADDARASEVVLTEAGSELARQAHRQVQEALSPYVERLDATQVKVLERVTQLIQGGAPVATTTVGP